MFCRCFIWNMISFRLTCLHMDAHLYKSAVEELQMRELLLMNSMFNKSCIWTQWWPRRSPDPERTVVLWALSRWSSLRAGCCSSVTDWNWRWRRHAASLRRGATDAVQETGPDRTRFTDYKLGMAPYHFVISDTETYIWVSADTNLIFYWFFLIKLSIKLKLKNKN